MGKDDGWHDSFMGWCSWEQTVLIEPVLQFTCLTLNLLGWTRTTAPPFSLAMLPTVTIGAVGSAPCLRFNQEQPRWPDGEQINLGKLIGAWLDNHIVEDYPAIGECSQECIQDAFFAAFPLADVAFVLHIKGNPGQRLKQPSE
jgi:hypothetical protein